MCINRRFDYPCEHHCGDLPEYCTEFKRLPQTEQDERKKEKPHRCPKGPIGVEIVKRSGKKEDVRGAVDRATKSLNRSLESLHLEKIRVGEFNLGDLKFPSARGCQRCHKAREPGLMATGPKWDKIKRLADIKDNNQAAFLEGENVPDHEEQRESAQRLTDQIGARTELGTHLLHDPFGLTLPMLLLSRPEAQKKRGNGVEGTSEPVEGSAEGGAD